MRIPGNIAIYEEHRRNSAELLEIVPSGCFQFLLELDDRRNVVNASVGGGSCMQKQWKFVVDVNLRRVPLNDIHAENPGESWKQLVFSSKVVHKPIFKGLTMF